MFVAATTGCYPHLSLDEAVEKLGDLEFSHIEIGVSESGNHLKPSAIRDNFAEACSSVMSTRRLTVVGLGLDLEGEGEEYLASFRKCCELAKACKIVTLTVDSGEHGTPFNEEVERYKSLVSIAEQHGVRVAMRSTAGRLSADPDTVSVICGHVKGLGLSLDPSHYHFGNKTAPNYEKLIEYVHNVYLRDSTADSIQVRVGQGVIDFGKLTNLLIKDKYRRAVCVDIQPVDDPDIDHDGEIRKLRLLLESLVLV